MSHPDESTRNAAEELGLRADVSDESAADDATAETAGSYQDHFLLEEETEAEFVAHVADQPAADHLASNIASETAQDPAVIRLAGADELTMALVGGKAEVVPVVEAPAAIEEPDSSGPEVSEGVPSHNLVTSAADDAPVDDVGDPAANLAAPQAIDDGWPEDEPAEAEARYAASAVSAPIAADPLEPSDLQEAEIADEVDFVEAASHSAEAPYAFERIDDEPELVGSTTGGGWTIPLMCLGIATIAFAMVIPQADANRRLAYERASLRADLESIQAQVATNDEFLRRLAGDATLAERLAQRQLNLQRAGTKALPIGSRDNSSSPFDLVKVPPPPAREPYEPVGGKLAAVCRDTRSRLYLMGAGLFVLGVGLIFGVSSPRR